MGGGGARRPCGHRGRGRLRPGPVHGAAARCDAWAAARRGEDAAALRAAALPRLPEATPTGLANLAWAAATARVGDAAWRDAVAAALARRADVGEQELSNAAWALAVLRGRAAGWAHARARPRLAAFQAQELANLAWSFAALRAELPPWPSVGRRAEFRPQEHALWVWSCGLLGWPLAPEWRAWTLGATAAMKPQEVSSLVTGLAALRELSFWPQTAAVAAMDPPSLVALAAAAPGPAAAGLVAAAAPRLAAFRAVELAGFAWGVASASGGAAPLGAVAAAARRCLAGLSSQEAANLLWSFAKADTRVPADLAAGSAARVGGDEQHVANAAYAVAKLRAGAPLGGLLGQALPSLARYSAQGLANLAWAAAEGRHDSAVAQLAAAASRVALGDAERAMVAKATAAAAPARLAGASLRLPAAAARPLEAWALLAHAAWLARGRAPAPLPPALAAALGAVRGHAAGGPGPRLRRWAGSGAISKVAACIAVRTEDIYRGTSGMLSNPGAG